MKSTPLIINWHDQNAPIYSAHFEPHGKGRLATAGGDNNVRIWRVESDGENRKVEYLSTLAKHTQAVNVVRWCPKGELLASGGDDGNVILWVPSETHHPAFGSDGIEDKETWRTKHMCRSSGAEIYDLAWSPDGSYFIIGSMDNIARIYNAATGVLIRQIAEHSHYVQGVTWDPLNEYIATQSSDRSVHIYSLRSKDGQYILTAGLDDKTAKIASHIKADLPPRRVSQSPAPPEPSLMNHRSQLSVIDAMSGIAPPALNSPVPSAPGTPTSIALPMNPPSAVSHSRRSSFSSRRSVSPAPSTMPLPAVMPMEASPKPHPTSTSLGMKNANLYANETLTSFFRRLTFTPDGSLLLTPAGQYQTQQIHYEGAKPSYEVVNTVYIYSRGGINKAPIAHLPGHKKPSVAVRCSPIIYTLRQSAPTTKYITIDTASAEEPIIPLLPDAITSNPTSAPTPTSTSSVMEPPPPPPPPPPALQEPATPGSKTANAETPAPATPAPPTAATPGPRPAFALSHRMIFAVATQDSVLLYDTQQTTPLCIVSNLHCATFTDLAWSSDGLTLLISSSDGFCSTLSFTPGELGQPNMSEMAQVRDRARQAAMGESAAAATGAGAATPTVPVTTASAQSTPAPTPTPSSVFAPPSPYPYGLSGGNGNGHQHRNSGSSFTAPSPPPTASFVSSSSSTNAPVMHSVVTPVLRPSSPARSNSASSILTQASAAALSVTLNNPQLVVSSMPGLGATSSKAGTSFSTATAASAATPPETPRNRASSVASSVAGTTASVAGTKREAGESDKEEPAVEREPKKRRIAPTLVSGKDGSV